MAKKKVNHNLQWLKFSDTFIIAGIPITAYILSFAYQSGYFGFFHIPTTFISFRLNNIFLVLLSVLSLMFIIFTAINFITSFFLTEKTNEEVLERFLLFLPILIYALVYFFLYFDISPEKSTIPIFIVGVFAVILFLLPIIRKKSGYSKNIASADQLSSINEKLWKGSLLDRLLKRTGKELLALVVYSYILLTSVNQAGLVQALSQKQYYVINIHPDTVILYFGDNEIITAPFNRQTRELSSSFNILTISGISNLDISFEEVGPLEYIDGAIKDVTIEPTTLIPKMIQTIIQQETPTR